MHYILRLTLLLLFSLATMHLLSQEQPVSTPLREERSANLNADQLEQIRLIIHKAGSMFQTNYDNVALYVSGSSTSPFLPFGMWLSTVLRTTTPTST